METTPVLFTPVVTTAEAAVELGVHRATIVNWVKSGRMHVARRLAGPRGGLALFTVDEVERVRKLPFDCPTCHAVFDSGQKLAAHRRRQHTEAKAS